MSNLHLAIPADLLEHCRHEASAEHVSLSLYVRRLLEGGPARLFAATIGAPEKEPTFRYLLNSAESMLDSEAWCGPEITNWLSEADRLTGFLKSCPYGQRRQERVHELFQNVPRAVLDHAVQTLARVTAG